MAVALNEAKAVKRLPSGLLPTPTASDDNETPALFKAPNKLGPVITEAPGSATGMNDTDKQPTPNMTVTDGGVFDFGFAPQMQLFAKVLQSLTLLLLQQAVMTQLLLNWRDPNGRPK